MTANATALAASTERNVPRLGGFNLAFLGLEIRRMMRNRRTVIFVLVFPAVFYCVIALQQSKTALIAPGSAITVRAYLMVSLAVYGAMTACASGGGMVAVERALGWSRQLRLTPLRPAAYIAIKILTAMVLGLIPVVVVFVLGAATGVTLSMRVWILCGLGAWLCSLVFATLGLFVGYLLPSENVMQVLGPILAVMAIFGGIFFPLDKASHALQTVAKFIPVYGVGEIARAPISGIFHWTSLLNVVAWTAIFAVGAALVFRRDTKRV